MNRILRQIIVSTAFLTLASASAQVFYDGFENGLGAWTVAPSAETLDVSTAQAVEGTQSALINSSKDRMYHNFGFEWSGPVRATWYLYDPGGVSRAYGEVRGYTGAGYADGLLSQLLAAGIYNSATMPGEVFSASYYQARVLAGTVVGWFNLNAAGAPTRSVGWHRFDVSRLDDGTTIDFYVDGVLSRTIAGATAASWDSIVLSSVAAGTSVYTVYVDEVYVPEPATCGLMAGLGLLGLGLWRRYQTRKV